MKSTGVLAIAAVVGAVDATHEISVSPKEPQTCPVTQPQGGMLENDALVVTLPSKFVFQPGGPGFVDSDGALGLKVGWERKKKGLPQIGGRRLDGSAAPARAYLYDYGDVGFQPIYLVFPTPGCWEITGSVADSSLTFITLVEKIGDGPSWRFEGLERGWRVSQVSVGDK
jgi:hypothetical protein